MRRSSILAVVVSSLVFGAFAAAQEGNNPPTVAIDSWIVFREGQVDPIVVFDSADPSTDVADIEEFIHYEGDFVVCIAQIDDPDWVPPVGEDDTNAEDEAVYLRFTAEWIANFRFPPEGPPVENASDQFFPEEDGFAPDGGELFYPFIFQIPDIGGRSQARLRGLQTFDVLYEMRFCAANENEPESEAVVGCDEVNVQVIENPDRLPVNSRPFADAGSDQTVGAGSTVLLDGSRTFDSFNVGFNAASENVFEKDLIQYTWEWITGPVRVEPTQTDVNDPTATVLLTTTGVYTYRLTVDDGVNANPTTDVVQISVLASLPALNPPSIVITGPAATVTVGAIITLDASATTDPDGDELSFRWVQTNALGATLSVDEYAKAFQPISGADAAVSTWQAISAGTFYFRVVVNDGDYLASAQFTVTVQEAATQAATAEADDGSSDVALDQLLNGSTSAMCGAGLMPLLALPLLGLARRLR